MQVWRPHTGVGYTREGLQDMLEGSENYSRVHVIAFRDVVAADHVDSGRVGLSSTIYTADLYDYIF